MTLTGHRCRGGTEGEGPGGAHFHGLLQPQFTPAVDQVTHVASQVQVLGARLQDKGRRSHGLRQGRDQPAAQQDQQD